MICFASVDFSLITRIWYCGKALHSSNNQDVCPGKQLFLNNQDIAFKSFILILNSLGFPLSLHDVSGRQAHARNIGKNGLSTHQPQPQAAQPYSWWPSARGSFLSA